MTLRDLRRAQDLTQERMAELLGRGTGQHIPNRKSDGYVALYLRSYITTMREVLDLIVRFPDRPDVPLAALFSNQKSKERSKGKSRRKRSADNHRECCPA